MKHESPTVRAYRELLGVTAQVTPEELKKAYYRVAMLYHPDRNPEPGAAAEFQKVKEAYEILGDPTRVKLLNHAHVREKLFNNVIEGLNISFGSFFGYRVFTPQGRRVARALRLGVEKPGESDVDRFEDIAALERDFSILDNPAYDSLEIVYAGKFSVGDEERLQSGLDGRQVVRLPWVVLNNQGILHFLNGEFRQAMKCYEELNARVPNNIIFMYRLGLCHVILGFKNSRRSVLGFAKPDVAEVEKGLKLFRHCIHIGEARSVGKQRCLLIRKFMADTLDRLGRRRQALQVWRTIRDLDPDSVEAAFRLQGQGRARELLREAKRQIKSKDR